MDYRTRGGRAAAGRASAELRDIIRLAALGQAPADAEVVRVVDAVVEAALAELHPQLRAAFDAIHAIDART